MLQETEAIVLKTIDWKETSKVVVFYTARHGKVSAIAKGVKRVKNSSIESIEPFTLVELIYYNKEDRDLQIVSKCAIKRFFGEMRQDLLKMAYASYVIQLVDELVSGRERSEALFDLAAETLAAIEKARELELIVRAFELKLVKILGYLPLLESCVSCRRPLRDLPDYLAMSNSSGGIICRNCRRPGETLTPISRGTILTLSYLWKEPIKRIGRLRPSSSTQNELKNVLYLYIRHLLGKQLKTRNFLEEIAG